jgi:hypothetical protein
MDGRLHPPSPGAVCPGHSDFKHVLSADVAENDKNRQKINICVSLPGDSQGKFAMGCIDDSVVVAKSKEMIDC